MNIDPILPEEVLSNTPSRKDGIDFTEELMHRVFGCELIQEAGILMKLPQVVMATGQNIFHRFFYRKSFKRYDAFTVAMGCILLACKIEEKPKYLRDVVFVFHHMYQRRKNLKLKPLELGGERYTSWKNELITIERFLLKELGFSFYSVLDHPHKYILYYIKMLNGTKELAQVAWNYLNDSLRLDLCLRYPAQEIACAAVFMASRKCDFPLPDSDEHESVHENGLSDSSLSAGNPRKSVCWWMLMTNDKKRILTICEAILELYRIPKVREIIKVFRKETCMY
jgi:hypothetical protein